MPVQTGDAAGVRKVTTSPPAPAPKPTFGATITPTNFPSEHGQGGGDSPTDPGTVEAPVLPDYSPAPAATDNSGGGGPDTNGPGSQPMDWADAFWGSLGLPPDLIAQLNSALAGYSDASIAAAVGQNIIRQSNWFAQNYPSFNAGLTAGLYTDENGYRSYVGQLNQLTQAFLGRPVSVADTQNYLGQGLSISNVGNILQGNAFAAAHAPELNLQAGAFSNVGQGPGGTLTQQQLQAYGQQQSGYDTQLGEQMKAAIDKASKIMSTIFQGKLATPAGMTLGAQGLNSPGLLGAKTPSSGLSNQVPA